MKTWRSRTVPLACTVLAATLLAGGHAAAASDGGYHAAFYTENVEFAEASVGETRQFIVGFTNVGDLAWIKGAANQEARLATAVPLDNRVDYDAGWAKGWFAPNRYAAQDDPIVTPRRVGYFTYSVVVPSTVFRGKKYFYGRPTIEGVGPLDDYGYYQGVNVVAAVKLTAVIPAGPSPITTPTVVGSGAVAGEQITINDGLAGAAVGSGSADQNGNFRIALSTALANGSHTLTPASESLGSGSGITYVVDTSLPPSVASVSTPTLRSLKVTFSKAMKCTSSANVDDMLRAENYYINDARTGLLVVVSTSTASSDCTSTTLALGSALVSGVSHTLRVARAQDQSSNVVSGTETSFVAGVDSLAPRVTWAYGKDTSTTAYVLVQFSKSMSTANGATGATSVTNPSNYTIDGAGLPNGAAITCQSEGCTMVRILFPTANTTSPAGASGSTHTVKAFNVTDYTGNNYVTPNPADYTFVTK